MNIWGKSGLIISKWNLAANGQEVSGSVGMRPVLRYHGDGRPLDRDSLTTECFHLAVC